MRVNRFQLTTQQGRVFLRDIAMNILNVIEEGLYARPSEEDVISAFRLLDKDRMGYLTVEKLREIMMNIGQSSHSR